MQSHLLKREKLGNISSSNPLGYILRLVIKFLQRDSCSLPGTYFVVFTERVCLCQNLKLISDGAEYRSIKLWCFVP